MATYYWVGGTGTWNNSSTTNWATSSGGAGGAGVPTSADNAIFDNLSNATAYAVTVGTNAVAADVTIAGPAAGNVTITMGATAIINCYGSWINAATGVVFSATTGATINMAATTTGKTFTSNSVTLSNCSVLFIGTGGGWTLGSAFTASSTLNIQGGSFSTGSFAVTTSTFTTTTSGVRSISLGSSSITLSAATPVNIANTTNLTFNAGTSTITCSNTSPTFNGGGLTYYNVSFTAVATGTTSISGANTFNNLTQTSRSAAGQRIVSLAADQTVTGTLTLQTTGTPNATVRTVVWSSVIGTRRTITAAALSGMTDVDFRDIEGAGAASWTGTRIGNLLNNTGITFTTGVNKYWVLAAGGLWNSSSAWALTPGGTPAAANFPLAQDTINIDLTTVTTGSTISISLAWQIPTIICTRASGSNTLILATTASPSLYGSWTSCSGMSFTGTSVFEFVGQGLTQTVTSASIPFTQGLTVNSPGGSVQLLDDLTTAANLTHTSGGLDLNSFTLTALNYNTSSTIAHTLAFSTTGKMVLTGNNATVVSGSGGNLSVTGTAPLIQFTYSGGTGSRNIVMPPLVEAQAISVEFLNNATDAVAIQGVSGGYKDITFTSFSGSLTFANTTNIFGNLYVCSGVTGAAGSGTTFAGTTGTTQTITTAGPSPITFESSMTKIGASPLQLQTAVALGTTRSFILTSGTLELNGFDLTTGLFSSTNSNVRTLNFGTNKIVLTGNATTVLNMGTSFNLTFLGTPQVEATYPGSTSTRTITPPATGTNLASLAVNVRVTAGGDIVLLSTTSSAYRNVEFTSGFTGTVQVNNSIQVYGDWTFSPNMVTPTTGTGNVNFVSTNATPRTITSNTKTFGGSGLTFNGVGGTWQLQDNLGTAPTQGINLANGTLDLNNFGTTSGSFSSTGSTTRAIAFGTTGSMTITGTTSTVFNGPTSSGTGIGISGNAQVYITGAGPALGTRSINGGNAAVQLQHFSFTISAGADTINSTAGMTWENMTFTSGFTGILANVSRIVYGDVTFHAGMSLGAGSSAFTLGATSGTKTITTAGLTLDFPVTFNGIGGTWAMQDALTLGSTQALTLTNGTLQLKSGTTSTVGSFVTPGLNQTYLQATTPGVQATIYDVSGTNTATFITIQDSNATGGATWEASNAVNPVNAGNNTGWNFAFSLSGVAGTGSVGTVTSGVSPTALSGVQATGSVGTIYIGWRDINTTQTQTWTPVVTS